MKKNYIIISVILVVILGIAVYFDIQDNKKINEEISTIQSQSIAANQNMQQNTQENMQENENTISAEELKIETLQEGAGEAAKAGDNLTVHYVGTLGNGTKFDSSIDRGEPFNFTLGAGQVISGWDKGMLGMKVGEKRKLTIPPDMGYGANDYGPIPGGSTLIFEIELLKINE